MNGSRSRGLPHGAPAATVLAVLGLVCGVALFAWKPRGGEAAAAAPAGAAGTFRPTAAQWAALSIEPVRLMRFRSEISTEGKIAIDEDRATRIYSQYAGRITRLAVGSGDAVQKGQLLFVIEAADSIETQKDFVSALGDLNKARSQVDLAAIVERRLGNLYRDRSMSLREWQEAQASLTAARNDLRTAEIGLQAVRNRLRLLGKTDAEVATFEKTGVITPDAPVHSPMAGTVLQRGIGPGQYIDAGASGADPVMLIGDVSTVWLVAYVREADANRVRLDQALSFTVLTLPGELFEARISFVASSLDPASRRLLVRARVANPNGRLKPEMFASARIVIDEMPASPAIARDAIIYEGEAARVWVAREDGTVEMRSIKVGSTDGAFAQVTEGLAADEKVVARGSLFIDRAAELRS